MGEIDTQFYTQTIFLLRQEHFMSFAGESIKIPDKRPVNLAR